MKRTSEHAGHAPLPTICVPESKAKLSRWPTNSTTNYAHHREPFGEPLLENWCDEVDKCTTPKARNILLRLEHFILQAKWTSGTNSKAGWKICRITARTNFKAPPIVAQCRQTVPVFNAFLYLLRHWVAVSQLRTPCRLQTVRDNLLVYLLKLLSTSSLIIFSELLKSSSRSSS